MSGELRCWDVAIDMLDGTSEMAQVDSYIPDCDDLTSNES